VEDAGRANAARFEKQEQARIISIRGIFFPAVSNQSINQSIVSYIAHKRKASNALVR